MKNKHEVTINIVGYDDWYLEKPWSRYGTIMRDFDVVFNTKDIEISYFIKDGIFKINNGYNSEMNVALLTECRLMDPVRYNFLEENHHLFDYVVTYDDKLIDMCGEKAVIVPYGGTWIWPIEKQLVYDKIKLCSFITSKKAQTENQKMRVRLLEHFYNSNVDIELFGRDHNPLPENHSIDYDGKLAGLKDFAFSLIIENHIQSNYFSEKLMDCFMTGTIPIYYGCGELEKYFNMDGVILFDSEDDVKTIIQKLTMGRYNNMIDAVNENYELAKKFVDSLSYSYHLIRDKVRKL